MARGRADAALIWRRCGDDRWRRLTEALVARDYGGLLLFDPLNIRYATDTTNMQLWNTHNPFRAVLLCADGHMVIWEYKNSPFLVTFNPLIREIRSGATFFYNSTGDRGADAARAFAAQVDEVMRAHAGTNRRLAVDKIMISGLRALERHRLRGAGRRGGDRACPRREGPRGHRRAALRPARLRGRHRRDGAGHPGGACQAAPCPRMRSGPCCTPRTSSAAANGSRRGFLPPAPAPTRGFRNAAQGSSDRTRSWPSTPT